MYHAFLTVDYEDHRVILVKGKYLYTGVLYNTKILPRTGTSAAAAKCRFISAFPPKACRAY